MSAFDNISVEKKDTLGRLTVNRPKALNKKEGTAAFMGMRQAHFI
jgi:enoyl-CoA hydratase/carnithine racemase